jgi:hypothetical protein
MAAALDPQPILPTFLWPHCHQNPEVPAVEYWVHDQIEAYEEALLEKGFLQAMMPPDNL